MLLHAGGPAAAPLPHPASATAIYLPRCGAPPTSPHWQRLACPPPMAEPDIGHLVAPVVIWTEQMHQRHKLWACRSPPPSLAPAHGALHAPPASTPPPFGLARTEVAHGGGELPRRPCLHSLPPAARLVACLGAPPPATSPSSTRRRRRPREEGERTSATRCGTRSVWELVPNASRQLKRRYYLSFLPGPFLFPMWIAVESL
jgi:hypothetical protein